ncbi:MAG: hypothetical protein J6T10_14345 [Methanobrevibacter sp.]|nr:hypothetical protein [Methanobrevibacter sp.]
MALDREDLLNDIIYTRIDLAICLLTVDSEYLDDLDIDMVRGYIREAIDKLELLL